YVVADTRERRREYVVEPGPIEVWREELASCVHLRSGKRGSRPLHSQRGGAQPRPYAGHRDPVAKCRADEGRMVGGRDVVECRRLLVEDADLRVAGGEPERLDGNGHATAVDRVSDLDRTTRLDGQELVFVGCVTADLVELEGALPHGRGCRRQVCCGGGQGVNPSIRVLDDRSADAHAFAGHIAACHLEHQALGERRSLALAWRPLDARVDTRIDRL